MIPVICLPDDVERIEQLEKKLSEYKKRVTLYANRKEHGFMDPLCKIFVLERLLEAGAASFVYLKKVFIEEYGENADLQDLVRAFVCMEDYCTTGGKNLNGGSGLS